MPLILAGNALAGGFADEIIDGRTCTVPGGLAVPWGPPIKHDRAWWYEDEWGTKPRTALADLLVGHWTAGEASLRTVLDDGPFVAIGMKKRQGINDPDHRLRVSVHFVIGADDANGRALVWQTADPLLTAAIHVGTGALNSRSVGVEIVNKGRPPAHPRRFRPTVRNPVAGLQSLRSLAYQPGQLRAWCLLADLLAAHLPIPQRVPARKGAPPPGLATPADVLAARFTRAQERAWRGAMEHYHVHSTLKLDGGGQLVRALAKHGWQVEAA